LFNKLTHFSAIVTRYDKLATNLLAATGLRHDPGSTEDMP
jgi:hypothetical protein